MKLLRKRVGLFVAAALSLGIAHVAAQPGGGAAAPRAVAAARTSQPTPEMPHEKYTLPNGLEVLLVPDGTVPLVAVSVWYHVGSGYETPGKSGFAHLFEHMLFQGSKHVGADRHFDVLKKMGSSNVNGTTNSDRTNYFEVVPSNQLEAVLWLESDRMGHLLPMLTQQSLDNQIDVVRNERRQRYDNVPFGRSRLDLADLMYPADHPYRYLTIGRHEDLESATLDDVIAFYKTWYVPANATLAIAGDFDVAATKRLVDQWFGSFPASKKPPVITIPMPDNVAARRETTDEFAKLRQVIWAWHTPAAFAAGDAELDLLASALAGGEASRLFKLLVVDKQLAQGVSAFQSSQQFSSTFQVAVTLRSDADLATVEQLVLAEVERARREPLTERELRRAVTQYEASAVYRLEDLLNRAETLQFYNHFVGTPGYLGADLERYRDATAEAVRAAAASFLPTERAAVLVTSPAAPRGAP